METHKHYNYVVKKYNDYDLGNVLHQLDDEMKENRIIALNIQRIFLKRKFRRLLDNGKI